MYYQGQSVIEIRNAPGSRSVTPTGGGGNAVLKQRVWAGGAGGYIDELVQIAIHHDPTDPTENRCHRFLYALHDANYNVMGVVGHTGQLMERYEYTPYGERQVFGYGWNLADLNGDGRVDSADNDLFGHHFLNGSTDEAQIADLDGDGDVDVVDLDLFGTQYIANPNHDNDPDLHAPRLTSTRVELATPGGAVHAPYGLCDIGHQGLHHDDETGLIHNRARTRSPRLGRFLQRDPLGYVDGMSTYAGYSVMGGLLDPTGLCACDVGHCRIIIWSAHITDVDIYLNTGGARVEITSGFPSKGWRRIRKWIRRNPRLMATFVVLAGAGTFFAADITYEYEVEADGAIQQCLRNSACPPKKGCWVPIPAENFNDDFEYPITNHLPNSTKGLIIDRSTWRPIWQDIRSEIFNPPNARWLAEKGVAAEYCCTKVN